MNRIVQTIAMLLLLLAAGCASTPPAHNEALAGVGTIAICPDILAPTNFVLAPVSTRKDGGTEVADVMQTVMRPLRGKSSTLWDRNADIREKVQPNEVLARSMKTALRNELDKSGQGLWRVTDGPADAELMVYISEMGFEDDAYNSLFGTVKPRLKIRAILAQYAPAEYTTHPAPSSLQRYIKNRETHPLLWQTNLTITASSSPGFLPGRQRDTYIRNPQALIQALEKISRLAARELVEEMRQGIAQSKKEEKNRPPP